VSIVQKTVETVVKGAPGTPSDPSGHTSNHVGKPIHRVDGQLKVTGKATFSAEFQLEHVAYGALVYSSIARGKIASIDQSAAASAPGVLGIVTHENAPTMHAPLVQPGGVAASNLPVMQSDEIFGTANPSAFSSLKHRNRPTMQPPLCEWSITRKRLYSRLTH
jgi:xanthine dehydrogenase YagR molybdenum-binding subunit